METERFIIRDTMDTPEDVLPGPDAISLAIDMVNWGRRCVWCGSKHVVYQINDPYPGPFERTGPYCYQCLLAACAIGRRIPYPIEEELLNQLEFNLGILPGPKIYYTFPEVPRL